MPHPEIGLMVYRAMSMHRRDWKVALSHALFVAQGNEASRKLTAFSEICQRQATWDLFLVSSAYAMRNDGLETDAEGVPFLYPLVLSLGSRTGRASLPGLSPHFIELASEIGATPLSLLFRAVPRLEAILREAKTLTAATASCLEFCLEMHPRDRHAFNVCIATC